MDLQRVEHIELATTDESSGTFCAPERNSIARRNSQDERESSMGERKEPGAETFSIQERTTDN